jgi:thiosulfate/3-mercaptopyruvate sulfurtransferase
VYHLSNAGFLTYLDYEQIVANSALDPATDPAAELVVDARSKGRYVYVHRSSWPSQILCRHLGVDPEPPPGLSSGHIPHSLPLPFNVFLKKHVGSEATYLLSPPELQKALVDAIGTKRANLVIKGEIPVCGSGMAAGVLWLGLRRLGVGRIGLYDDVS